MANTYKKLFETLKRDIIKSVTLGALLDTIIFYIIINTIISILELPMLYVFIISITSSLIFSVIIFKRKYEQQSLHKFEQENPELKVILRTAKEYTEEDTLMTHAMFYDLFERVKKVSTGTLIKPKEIYIKFLTISILSLVMVSLATIGTVNVGEYAKNLNLNINKIPWFNDELKDINNITFTTDDDIYGDKNIAILGDEKIDINVASGFSESDLTQKSDADDLSFKNSNFYVEPELEAAQTSDESPIQETELGRAYLQYLKEK